MISNTATLTDSSVSAAASPEPTEQTFAEWKAYLLPKPDELAWEEIPWRPSFWAAVEEALRTEKPLLLWMMNGHPLACT
jgi:hypothetical protein